MNMNHRQILVIKQWQKNCECCLEDLVLVQVSTVEESVHTANSCLEVQLEGKWKYKQFSEDGSHNFLQ
jgi:hypothetical protein